MYTKPYWQTQCISDYIYILYVDKYVQQESGQQLFAGHDTLSVIFAVQDLGKALAVPVIVFNCSDGA